MIYRNVCLEAFTYTLPEEVVTSEQIEGWLRPTYNRLRLPDGRLRALSGIAERRFWPPGTLPSDKSSETAEKVLRLAGLDRRYVGALIHGSVCRDQLEPASACRVHDSLGLSRDCMIYDVSNACLGLVNGILQVANMIELGQIRAGLVVGTESSRSLVEATIKRLNADAGLTRRNLKLDLASLTTGSGSAAVLLVDHRLSRTDNRLLGGVARSFTAHYRLCQGSGDDPIGGQMRPSMATDSVTLMREGVAAGQETFPDFLRCMGWGADDIHKTFCHQVSRKLRKLTFEALDLDQAIDYGTLEYLGNTGAVALPVSAALGIENGHLQKDDHLALMGFGSGINVIMLGVHWKRSLAEVKPPPPRNRSWQDHPLSPDTRIAARSHGSRAVVLSLDGYLDWQQRLESQKAKGLVLIGFNSRVLLGVKKCSPRLADFLNHLVFRVLTRWGCVR